MKVDTRQLVIPLFLLVSPACGDVERSGPPSSRAVLAQSRMSNNHPLPNPGGQAASFSTEGFVELDNEFHTPQGTNGRSCGTCHLPEDGWSIRPETAQRLFDETDGLHPLFNIVDANNPFWDVSTVEARRETYSMLLQGKFLRLRRAPSNREYDVIAASDPFGLGSAELLLFFRRPLPTANLKSRTVMWDGANTVASSLRDGLIRQARSNVIGAQQGLPAPDAVIFAIVDHELSLSHAQLIVPGLGRLDAAGASGGPEAQAAQPLVAGRFDLFDAWMGHPQPRRAQIARGQELFNNVNPGSGRACGSCHNAANNGQNVGGALFDVGTSSPARRKPDMAVYTLQRRGSGEILETTDWGRGGVTGLWKDLNRFKTSNLRGLAARAPYFHNGIADTLLDVVHLYEASLGFAFTPEEEADLVAFMNAL
jgi:cytochrome c peroxidase